MVETNIVLTLLQTISIMVGIGYYILNIQNNQKNQKISLRNQELTLKSQQLSLEARQAQLFMGIYNNSFGTIQFAKANGLLYRTTWDSFDEFNELRVDEENIATEFMDAYSLIAGVLEGVGVLVREGLLDIRFVALLLSGPVPVSYTHLTLPTILLV